MSLPDYRKARHGRTWPEATHNAGWAGTVHKRSRVPDVLFTVVIFGALGVLLFWELAK